MPRASEADFQTIQHRGSGKRYFVRHFGRPRFNEIDHYGVLWNGHYVNYFELGRHALCLHCRFDMKSLADAGYFLPVASYEIKMRKPVFPRDEITVAVRPSAISENRYEFTHLLLVGDEIRASGVVQHVPVSKETGSIAYQLPPDVAAILSPLSEVFNDG